MSGQGEIPIETHVVQKGSLRSSNFYNKSLVDKIEIAKFEHYCSNLKEFQLLGSLVYPYAQMDRLELRAGANLCGGTRNRGERRRLIGIR